MPLPTIGQPAPSFQALDQQGKPRTLEEFKGKWLLIYFYPKALTPGCTTQACTLRDGKDFLLKNNIDVVGVSADKPELLQKFIDKESLNFTLLSDPNFTLCEAYGAWQKKSLYGKTFMGIQRMSVLIDDRGTVRQIWPKVKPADQLKDLQVWFTHNKV